MSALKKGEPYNIHDFCKFSDFCHPWISLLTFCSFRKFCRTSMTGSDYPAVHLVWGLFIWCEVKVICFRNCITVFEYRANVVITLYLRCLKLRALFLHIGFRKHRKVFCLSMFSWMFSWPKPLCKFSSSRLILYSCQRRGQVIWKYI